MDKWLLIAAMLALGAAVGLIVLQRRRTARLMDGIERMLRAAMDGSFSEENFTDRYSSCCPCFRCAECV